VCKGWSAAEPIDADTGDGQYPEVAMNPSGQAVAVWQDSSSGATQVWANRYTPGSGWGTARRIDTGTENAAYPRVGIDAVGNAIAVWPKAGAIWASRGVVAGTWAAPQRIEGTTSPNGWREVVVHDDGDAVVVWTASPSDLVAARFSPSTGWSSPIVDSISSGCTYPDLIDLSESAPGAIFVSWSSLNKVCARKFTTPGGWGTEIAMSRQAGGQARPRVGASSDGIAIMLAPELNSTTGKDDLVAYRYNPGSGWSAGLLLAEDASGETAVTLLPGGDAMAAWMHHEGTIQQTWASRYAAGTGWETPVSLSVDGFGDDPARLSESTDGSVFLVLNRQNAMEEGVFVRRFAATRGWSEGSRIGPMGANIINAQSLAVDASGNAVVVWAQIQDSHTRVWASRYGQ